MKSEKLFSQDKNLLRKQIKELRANITDKKNRDEVICQRFLSSDLFSKCDTVLVYCALSNEINTDLIIRTALSENKRVAVPCCINMQGTMEFYYINSLDDLHLGSFNIPEPDINVSKIVDNFLNALIIVPGLCFDKKKYRLGYGRGYYDRYLQIHSLISVGLCYNSLVIENLPTNVFDKRVDYIITESQFLS